MRTDGRTIYTIQASATAAPRAGAVVTVETRRATITVRMQDMEPHTSIDILEEARHLTMLGYTVTLDVSD